MKKSSDCKHRKGHEKNESKKERMMEYGSMKTRNYGTSRKKR